MSTQSEQRRESAHSEIRTRPCPDCFICGATGQPLYQGLTDRLFDAPGVWNLKRCPCPGCGLLWLDPMPLEEDIGKAYASYFTHGAPPDAPPPPKPAPLPMRRRAAQLFRSSYQAWRYNYGPDAGKPLRWLLAMPIRLSRIECDGLDIPLRYLAVPEKGRMLDVGCGDGGVLKLAEECGWQAEGVDFDPEAVANARHKGLSVRRGSLEDQHYPDNSFDLVLMSHVIEHVHDPLGTLREIRRTLRPGGTVVVTTPNLGSQGYRHFGRDWVHLDPPRHLNLLNAVNLRTLAERAGFRVTAISSSLRMTSFSFVESSSIAETGKFNQLSWPLSLRKVYGRGASALQLFARMRDPLAADELLLEARR